MSTGFKITMAAILSVVAYFAYDVWNQPATVTVDMNEVPADQRDMAAAAVQQLFTTCEGLKRYKSGVEWLKASTVRIDPDLVYDPGAIHERYGWPEWVAVEVKLTDDISTPHDWNMGGNHLFYAIGQNGVVVQKEIGGHFCGIGNRSDLVALR